MPYKNNSSFSLEDRLQFRAALGEFLATVNRTNGEADATMLQVQKLEDLVTFFIEKEVSKIVSAGARLQLGKA